MQIEKYTPSLSRNALLMILMVTVVLLVTIVLNRDFILNTYFDRQLTYTGLLVNGLILLMFFLGMGKIVANLLFYRKQEVAIANFLENDFINPDMAMANIDENSLIAQRYKIMHNMWRNRCSINQDALAAILVAGESARNSLTKFVNNILILTGVFGTIVSLSIALLGASNLLQTTESLGGMNLVVHGMSTALSTTITAIICFMFFSYFHVRSNDVQTHVVSMLERVSLERLMPRFSVSQDRVLGEIADLVQVLREASESIRQGQLYVEGGASDERLAVSADQQNEQLQFVNQQLQEVLGTLRVGFRLDH